MVSHDGKDKRTHHHVFHGFFNFFMENVPSTPNHVTAVFITLAKQKVLIL